MAKILACHLHDYIEVMCLYQYTVLITLNNGKHITAKFDSTGFIGQSTAKQEVIYGKDINGADLTLILTDIKTVTVLTKNAQFNIVHF
ncbi:Rho-binding antiterminator [Shewanella sp. OMA3-2]|uniref:Rho-binding antiterminator n=1 Tax=Shewanella sp. OMA3-2 TaxID=2908650 RepID=UPI001F2B9EF9|nr:Rho-binding antiterminator [Shewanella sp. OMA3-2]UJF20640.1 Rho-binding antiterminator [Shewanella sp. OMA3-2]